MSIFTTSQSHGLKRTLSKVVTDKNNGMSSTIMAKIYRQRRMKDHYEDDLEVGGPGLATEKAQGGQISVGSITEGYLTRYFSRTFALRLNVTEEALEDQKYDTIIDAAKRLKRAMVKTVEIDAANLFARAWNTSYTGGDGQPLFSASHTLPSGGTFSNTLATPLTPSKAAIATITSACRQLPGHDGITEGYEPVKVLAPEEQWATWMELTESTKDPTLNSYNAVNIVRSLGLTVVTNRYWTNTTTNWMVLTDCPNGLNWRWRRRPRNNSWVENSQEVMSYKISSRWSRGWTDPRCAYGSQV